MANKESIAKTRLGMVATFQDLFDNVHYVKEFKAPNNAQGYPAGHLYLGIEWAADAGLPSSFRNGYREVLCCRPRVTVPQFSPSRAPRHGEPWVTQPAGSVKVIRWPCGDYLVLFTDPNFIRDEWLAFVPSDQTIKLVED